MDRRSCVVVSVFVSVLLISYGNDCLAQCDAKDMITWNPILNESAYDLDPNSLKDIKGRPYGFALDDLPYNDNEDPQTPCISITGAADKRIEIMVETDPPATICIRDVDRSDADDIICQPSIYDCRQALQDNVTFQFFCHGISGGVSCDQSTVNFWYRFVISTDPSVLDPELWCDGRDAGQFPSSLIQPPPDVVDPAPTEPPGGSGVSLTAAVTTLLMALITVFGIVALH